MKDTRIIKICELCGREYKVKLYRAADSRYCSKACWSRRNPPQPRQCEFCGKTFNSLDKSASFCSRQCAGKIRTGDKANAWKGGTSLNTKRAQAKGELAQWRKAVYERDSYTCQKCGAHGTELHAHHIKPVAKYPELITQLDNGVSLCVPCHEKEHGRKLTSPAKFPRHCMKCGAQTSGRSELCRSCSIAQYHKRIGHRQTKQCPQCGSLFPARTEQIFCSIRCNAIYHHAHRKSSISIPEKASVIL